MPTKKTATPKVAKKTSAPKKSVATKKSTAKSTAKKAVKPLVYSSDSTSFWTTNGQILNSLHALKEALEAMPKDVYQYHAGGEHNDFANWVEVVLCDGDCATELRKAKTPTSAKTIVVKHLKYYSV